MQVRCGPGDYARFKVMRVHDSQFGVGKSA
jgi:hypothetical protein